MSRSMFSFASLCLVTAMCATATVGRADPLDDASEMCESIDPDTAIAGCSAYMKLMAKDERAAKNANMRLLYRGGIALGQAGRGRAHGRKGDHVKAEADFDQATKLMPDMPAVYRFRAEYLMRKGDHIGASAAYDECVKRGQTAAWTYFARASYFFKRGDNARAEIDLETGIKIAPRDDAFFERAKVFTELKMYDRAIADYDEVIRINPKGDGAYANRGALYSLRGEYDRAIADLDTSIGLDPKDALGYAMRGGVELKRGNFDKAVADYDRALKIKPKNAVYWNQRGHASMKAGDSARAVLDLDRALAISPNLAAALDTRGDAYRRLGKLDFALADLSKAIALDGSEAIFRLNRGLVYRDKGELAHAVSEFEAGLRLEPDNAEIRTALADARGRVGNSLAASDATKGQVDAPPSPPNLTIEQAQQICASEQPEKALPACEIVIQAIEVSLTKQTDGAARASQVWTLVGALQGRAAVRESKRDFVGAMADLDRAIKLLPEDWMSYLHRAYLHAALGDRTKAGADLGKAAHFGPADEDARKVMVEAMLEVGALLTGNAPDSEASPRSNPGQQLRRANRAVKSD